MCMNVMQMQVIMIGDGTLRCCVCDESDSVAIGHCLGEAVYASHVMQDVNDGSLREAVYACDNRALDTERSCVCM